MYARKIADQELNFAVSGMLWNRSLVMIDSQTKSLWSQLLGKSMRGELQDQRLKSLPSVITDWKTWQRDHPTSSVLNMSRTAERFQADFYRDPSQFVLGMARGTARSWPYDQLKRQPVVNDLFGKLPVLIVFDPTTATAWPYDRRVEGQTLEFRLREDGTLEDQQTGSSWNIARGEATAGPLKGKRLKPALAIVSYAKAWDTFHPNGTTWQAR